MAILIGFGLSGLPVRGGTEVPEGHAHVASVAALPVADAVFDSGFARGANAADIPLTGSTDAADGAQIEARIVRADTGAQVHPWAAIATAAGGAWSGAFPAATRSPHWLKAEVRVRNSTAAAGTMSGRFAVGHVWAWYGQSNVDKFALQASGTLAPDTITEPGNFQLWYVLRGTPGAGGVFSKFIDNEPGNTPAVGIARFANLFAQARPGEKVAIAVHSQSGEGAISMIDADPTREWVDEVALNTAFTAHGTQVGMVLSLSWTAFVNNNAATMVPIMTKKSFSGVPLNTGDSIPGGTLDHDMTEFYDLSYTKMGFIGSSGRSLGPSNGSDVVTYTTTAQVENPTAQGIATGWQTVMADKANFPEMLDFQWSHETAVMRGEPDGSGGWRDWIHFSFDSPHGFPYLGEIYANQIMRMLGMIDFDIPEITHSNWTPTHIDVWNPDHDITTRAVAQGGTSPFVRGFAFDGQLMTTEAQLIADAGGSGRQGVRITPAGGVNGSETFTYSVGVQPGLTSFPEDYYDEYVTDLPVILAPGMVGTPGLPVKPRQLADPFVSNLAGTPSFSNAPAYILIQSPSGLGSPFQQLTIEGEIRRTIDDTGTIASMSGPTGFLFQILRGGDARFSSGLGIGTTSVPNAFPMGVFVPFVWTVDFAAQTGQFWYGDSGYLSFGTGTGNLSDTRGFSMRGANEIADVRFIQMWKDYAAIRDTSGLGAALKRIEADASGNPVQVPTLPSW